MCGCGGSRFLRVKLCFSSLHNPASAARGSLAKGVAVQLFIKNRLFRRRSREHDAIATHSRGV